MKTLLKGAALAAVLASAAAVAQADGIQPPPIDPVIVADTTASDGSILVPLLGLIFLLAGTSN